MNNRKLLLGPMRVPFLILAPCCALLGVGTAVWTSGQANLLQILLVLIGALAGHVSVNAFNEYFDFKSGLDANTTRTPFSGGSGTLQAHPEMENKALAIAVGAIGVTVLVGAYFVALRGVALLPIWVLGVVISLFYTPWIARQPLLCLVAPGLGFGPVIVIGSHMALTGQFSWIAFAASLVPFFLVSDLLLLNQFPDVEADKSSGRRNFPIVIGRKASSLIYAAFVLLAYVAIVAGVIAGYLPVLCLLGLLTLPIGWRAMRGAYQYADDIGHLIPSMGMNVILNLATPVLVAVGLFVSLL